VNALLAKSEELFLAALAQPEAERGAFVERGCAGDVAVRAETERLLRAHRTVGDFLETPVSLAVAESSRGARIGRYQLREKLGEGGVGIVFLAEQAEPFRRQVALKVIKPGMDTREVIARFESERQALALMDHPHIARVFDAGTTAGGRPYFVMELVSGVPCTRFCDEERLTLDERLALFVKICRAIAHAHAKGVIHRDIKPANLLVARYEGEPVPKVIDFGIAKATEFKLTEKTVHTTLAHFMGTPAYMSPEQAGLGGRSVDARSDVYSLGVLLYELLVGRTPFDGQSLASTGADEVRRRIRDDAPGLPSARLTALAPEALGVAAQQRQLEPARLLATVRGELEWVAMRCLEKDPARRFDSANALPRTWAAISAANRSRLRRHRRSRAGKAMRATTARRAGSARRRPPRSRAGRFRGAQTRRNVPLKTKCARPRVAARRTRKHIAPTWKAGRRWTN